MPLVIVPVTNMDRARDFYCSGLGLPVRSMSPAWTVVGDDGQLIALEPGGTTGVDLRIGLEAVDLRGSLRAVAAAGGVVESQNGGVARVVDPDGNRLHLYRSARGVTVAIAFPPEAARSDPLRSCP